ncbi:hypothetical protein [Spirosoma arcticum]
MTDESMTIIRHVLASIAYRLAKAVRGVDAAFYEMESGNGIRKPAEILRHMGQVLSYTNGVLTNMTPINLQPLDGDAELDRFYDLLNQVDEHLAETNVDDELGLKLIQGPFADVLTHIGQLALLRRAFGDPVPGENFMKAAVQMGRLNREEQALSDDLFNHFQP